MSELDTSQALLPSSPMMMASSPPPTSVIAEDSDTLSGLEQSNWSSRKHKPSENDDNFNGTAKKRKINVAPSSPAILGSDSATRTLSAATMGSISGTPASGTSANRINGQSGSADTPGPSGTPSHHASHSKLGPKANQGSINAQLRALDRSGKPCRKWKKIPFELKSFTGFEWSVDTWYGGPRELTEDEKAALEKTANKGKSDKAKAEDASAKAILPDSLEQLSTSALVPPPAPPPLTITIPSLKKDGKEKDKDVKDKEKKRDEESVPAGPRRFPAILLRSSLPEFE
ncbi:INO80 complex subunit Ies4-domain-containing protein [Dipodascopsis uninucleata]